MQSHHHKNILNPEAANVHTSISGQKKLSTIFFISIWPVSLPNTKIKKLFTLGSPKNQIAMKIWVISERQWHCYDLSMILTTRKLRIWLPMGYLSPNVSIALLFDSTFMECSSTNVGTKKLASVKVKRTISSIPVEPFTVTSQGKFLTLK